MFIVIILKSLNLPVGISQMAMKQMNVVFRHGSELGKHRAQQDALFQPVLLMIKSQLFNHDV